MEGAAGIGEMSLKLSMSNFSASGCHHSLSPASRQGNHSLSFAVPGV